MILLFIEALAVLLVLVYIYRRTRNVLLCASVYAGFGFIENLLEGKKLLFTLEVTIFSFVLGYAIFWVVHKFFP